MYSLTVKGNFDAAHHLPGIETCERLHGHRFNVEVTITGTTLNDKQMLIDFRDIKESWKRFDHRYLNDFFKMPTAEVIANDIYCVVKERILASEVRADQYSQEKVGIKVKVWESPDACVEYWEEK